MTWGANGLWNPRIAAAVITWPLWTKGTEPSRRQPLGIITSMHGTLNTYIYTIHSYFIYIYIHTIYIYTVWKKRYVLVELDLSFNRNVLTKVGFWQVTSTFGSCLRFFPQKNTGINCRTFCAWNIWEWSTWIIAYNLMSLGTTPKSPSIPGRLLYFLKIWFRGQLVAKKHFFL